MSLDGEMYRKFANDCIDRAQRTQDDDAAAGLIRLAQFWLTKADKIDGNLVLSRDVSASSTHAGATVPVHH
jgi:hypothetical protein